MVPRGREAAAAIPSPRCEADAVDDCKLSRKYRNRELMRKRDHSRDASTRSISEGIVADLLGNVVTCPALHEPRVDTLQAVITYCCHNMAAPIASGAVELQRTVNECRPRNHDRKPLGRLQDGQRTSDRAGGRVIRYRAPFVSECRRPFRLR